MAKSKPDLTSRIYVALVLGGVVHLGVLLMGLGSAVQLMVFVGWLIIMAGVLLDAVESRAPASH